MSRIHVAGVALVAMGAATSAAAVGLDRSNQDVGIIFEEGDYAELSFGYTMPDVSGEGFAPFGAEYDDVAGDYTQLSLGYKAEVDDRVSLAVILDQPFGADVSYPGNPDTTFFGGTDAELDSVAVTGLVRYRIDERFSLHGGLRWEEIDGNITLAGQAYGPLSGYSVDLEPSSAWGYVLGAAYEIPDIALRVALTYNSSIEHEFDSTETVGGAPASPPSVTKVETPESWNLDLQTGIAPDTLLFGSVRYAEYERVIVSPGFFGPRGGSLTDIDDNYEVSLGIGRAFSGSFSGSISVGYEPEGEDDLVSPLAPTNGDRWVQAGGSYTIHRVTFTGGVRYTVLGDARPATGDPETGLASFEDNDAVSLGLTVGYRF